MSAVHDALWLELNKLDKPVTREGAVEAARKVLDAKQLKGFEEWMKKNADYLLGRLNA